MDFLANRCLIHTPLWVRASIVSLLVGHVVNAQAMAPVISSPTASPRTGLDTGVISANAISSSINPPVNQATLSLTQAQAYAIQQQPLQQLWQQRQRLAQAQVLQSGLRTNPELSVEQTGLNSRQEQELSIGISQKLDLFGERQARQSLANIQLSQDDLLRECDEAELKLLVSMAYWQLAQAEWQLTLLQQQQNLSQQALAVAKKRLEAGRIAQVDYQRVDLAHQAQLQKSQTAQAQHQMARLQLAQVIGGISFLPPQLQQPIQFPAVTEISARDLVEQALPFQALHQQRQQQQIYANTALQLAKIQAKPQPTLSIAYVQNKAPNALNNERSQRVALGLSVPFPVFNKNQGIVQAQSVIQQSSQQQAAWHIQQLQHLAEQQSLSLQRIQQQYQHLTIQQLPIAQQIWQKTLIGFDAGKFAVLEVQQASRDYQQLQAEQLDLLQQAWQLTHRLQALHLGISLSDVNTMLDEFNQRMSTPFAIAMPQGE